MTKLKVLCCCGAGMGTCMILRAKTDKVLTKLGADFKIDNESVQQGMTMYKSYNLVLCNVNLANKFKEPEKYGVKVIGLENVTSLSEIEAKVLASGVLNK